MVNGYIISELISLYDEHIHFSLSLFLSLLVLLQERNSPKNYSR